ncbi:MAG: DUF2628 domain-containing protein [Gammaproteobacteria bacterium]|nr:DUF2628 domain-containing protein [Gammaproteobacteria bacterium]
MQNDINNAANSEGVGRDNLDKEDILKFTETDYYLKVWRATSGGAGGLAAFNWMAFLFGSLWFFFRKMYLLGVVLLVLGFVGSMILPIIIGVLQLNLEKPVIVLSSYLSLFVFVRIPAGLFANKIYYKHTSKLIKEADAHGLAGDVRAQHFSKVGGTNNGIVIVAIVVNWIINFYFQM